MNSEIFEKTLSATYYTSLFWNLISNIDKTTKKQETSLSEDQESNLLL